MTEDESKSSFYNCDQLRHRVAYLVKVFEGYRSIIVAVDYLINTFLGSAGVSCDNFYSRGGWIT